MPHIKKDHAESLDAASRINREFGHLLKLVYEGHPAAAKCLHDVLQGQLRTFTYICNNSPKLFESLARQKIKWPGFFSDDANVALENEHLAKKLNLGASVKIATENPPETEQ
jgi:hypothetical protein